MRSIAASSRASSSAGVPYIGISRREVPGVDAVEVDEQPFVAAGLVEVREVREGTEAGACGRGRLYVSEGLREVYTSSVGAVVTEQRRQPTPLWMKPLEACPPRRLGSRDD